MPRLFPLSIISGRLILVLSTGTSASTTDAQFRFDSWTTDNGLPQASVNSILQTRDGFLWFTTFGGLVRYDGLRFQVFNTGNTQGLRTSRFQRLLEDREGTLWISTEGQGITRYKDGSFVTYTKENGLPDNWIQDLFKDVKGDALLESGDRLFQLKGKAFLPYAPTAGEPVRNIIYRTSSGGSWYLDGARLRKFENGRVTIDFTPEFPVRRVIEDSQGRLWIGGNGNLLSMFKDGKLTTYGEHDGFPPSRLNTVFEDRSGRLWLVRVAAGYYSSKTISSSPTRLFRDCSVTMSVPFFKTGRERSGSAQQRG